MHKKMSKQFFFILKEARTSITMSQNGKIVYKAPSQKLTLNTAFKQIIGKALEPYGFKGYQKDGTHIS